MSSRSQGNTRRPIEELRHRIAALERHHAHPEARLRDALSPLAPDAGRVNWIKAEKLRVKDEIARLATELQRRTRPRRDRPGDLIAAPAAE